MPTLAGASNALLLRFLVQATYPSETDQKKKQVEGRAAGIRRLYWRMRREAEGGSRLRLRLPAVYRHDKKYKWVKNLTIEEKEEGKAWTTEREGIWKWRIFRTKQ